MGLSSIPVQAQDNHQTRSVAAVELRCIDSLQQRRYSNGDGAETPANTAPHVQASALVASEKLQESLTRQTPGAFWETRFLQPNDLAAEDQIEIYKNMLTRMADGYRLSNIQISRKTVNLEFTHDLPAFVVEQSRSLLERFGQEGLWHFHNASRREMSSRGKRFENLTAKNLNRVKPGLYAFVLLTTEGVLRIGNGHPEIGEMRPVYSAGDLLIQRNPSTGENEVAFLSNRTDTYRPSYSALPSAIFALWRNGIYPRTIEFRAWNNETVVFQESGTPTNSPAN